MEIGQRLQLIRKQHNISQEQLADSLNVSRQTISRWESSITSPDIETLQKICDYYDISLVELLGETKHKNTLSPVIFITISFLFIVISFFIPTKSNELSSVITFSYSTIILILGTIGIMISCILFYKSKVK